MSTSPRPVAEGPSTRPATPTVADPYGDAIDLGALVRPLWDARLLIAAAVLTGIGIGVALAWTRPSVYEATATLMLRKDPSQPSTSSYRSLIEGNSFGAGIVSRFKLDGPPYGYTPQSFAINALAVEEIRNTDLLRLRVRLLDPKLAADVANVVAEMALELSQQLANPPTVLAGAKQQLANTRGRLQEAQDRLLEFKNTAQVDAAKTDATAALAQRGDILELIINIESERAKLAAAEAEIKKTPSRLSEPRGVSAEQPMWRDLGARRATDTVRRQRATDTVERQRPATPGSEPPPTLDPTAKLDLSDPLSNPVYEMLRYQIAMSRTALAGLEQRRRALVAERRLGGPQLAALTKLYGAEIQLARLQTEHDLAARLHLEVSSRYEQMRLQADVQSSQLLIVDRAFPPTTAMPRGRTRLVMTSTLLAALLAIVLVFGRHLLAEARRPERGV